MLETRAAQDTDRPQIIELWHQGWHDAHAQIVPPDVLAFRTKDHFATWISEAHDTFYVALDADLVGFVSINGAELVKFYIGRKSRGTGTAQNLLSFAERLLARDGVKEAKLLCTAGNSRARNFYEREGWRRARSFDDVLWVPKDIARQFWAQTHEYRKPLVSPDTCA